MTCARARARVCVCIIHALLKCFRKSRNWRGALFRTHQTNLWWTGFR